MAASVAEPAKDEAAAGSTTQKDTQKVNSAPKVSATAKPATAKKDVKSSKEIKDVKKKPVAAPAAPAKTAKSTKITKEEAPKPSIETKRAQVKAML